MVKKFQELISQERKRFLANRRCPRTPLIIALALFAQACAVGPDFRTPPAMVVDKWVEQRNKSVDSRASDYRDWWVVFNDPRLTRLIQLAYQQNLTLQTAGVRVLEARAQLGIAIGEFYPQKQQAGASLNYNRIPISFPYNFVTNTFWANEVGTKPHGNSTFGGSSAALSNPPMARF